MKRFVLPLIALLLSFFLLQSCASASTSKEMAGEYYSLAEGYTETGKYGKAVALYKKAALRKEYRNAADFGLARAYALDGNWAGASSLLERLHKADPGNVLVTTAYAYALVSSGDVGRSLALYKALYDQNPEDSVCARNYAELLFLAGKYDETAAQIAVIKEKFIDTEGAKGLDSLEKKLATALAPKEAPPGPTDKPDAAPPPKS
jgi:predicted Zn-dependent protease